MADVHKPIVISSDDESDYIDSDYGDSDGGQSNFPRIDENLLGSNVETGHAAGRGLCLKFPTQQLQPYVVRRSPLPHSPLSSQTPPKPSSASAGPLVEPNLSGHMFGMAGQASIPGNDARDIPFPIRAKQTDFGNISLL
jgi:hypothetical protein